MTISGFQSYSFSAITLNMTVTSAAPTSPAPSALPPASDTAADRVSLSPEATTAAAPTPSVPPPSRAARRADALFTALDGDEDGAITTDEFKEGALTLLRNASARRRVDDADEGDFRSSRKLDRLERKLDKIFDRVDRNDDGAIDKDELTAALSRGRGRRGGVDGPSPADAAPPDGQAAGAGALSISVSVTYVSIAVQRYTSLQHPADAPETTAATVSEPAAYTPAIAA